MKACYKCRGQGFLAQNRGVKVLYCDHCNGTGKLITPQHSGRRQKTPIPLKLKRAA